MKRTGIISAMIEEINFLLKSVDIERTETIGQREYYIGKFENKEVVLVFSRWGKVASSSTVTTLINIFDVKEVIFTGVAGSIDESINIGDVVIAEGLIQHDFDASPFLEENTLPFINKKSIPSDKNISEKLFKSCEKYFKSGIDKTLANEFNLHEVKAVMGNIASGDQFIKSDKRRSEIKNITDNIYAVEMEGAAIAQVCFEYNVPFAVIRTISDSANSSAPVDFSKFVNEVASEYSYNILKHYMVGK